MNFKYAVKRVVFGNTLIVHFSDGTSKLYDVISLGCAWFRTSNERKTKLDDISGRLLRSSRRHKSNSIH